MAKVKTDFRQARAKLKTQIRKTAQKTLPPLMEKLIIDEHILKGKSPVQGFGRFKAYSESYKKQIRRVWRPALGKRIRPVNLKLSGQMLSTFFTKTTKAGFIVGFDDKLADIHNRQGAGKARVIRRILPIGTNEGFNRAITRELNAALARIVNKVVRRRS